MPDEPFFERFRALLQAHNIRPEEAAAIMGVGIDAVRRFMDGRNKTQPSLDQALRLCVRLGEDPWELAGVSAPEPADFRVEFDDGSRLTIEARYTGAQQPTAIAAGVASALSSVFGPSAQVIRNDQAVKMGAETGARFATSADLDQLRAEWKAFRADFQEALDASRKAQASSDTEAVPASRQEPPKPSPHGSEHQKAR
jgi:transcriptional regulator with XRE-family HTH domain